jgi:hypothetical protein
MHIQNRDFCKAHGLALMLGSIGVMMGCQIGPGMVEQ